MPEKYIRNWFSNMLPMDEPYVHQGISYKTTEHFYQAMKLPKDRLDLRAEIAELTPFAAKKEIRKYELRPDWESVKMDVMRHILRVKFRPGTSWASKLLETGDEPIIENNNWGDVFWGFDVKKQKGENHLGKLLEQIRADWNNYPISHFSKQKHTKYIGRPKSGETWGFGNPFIVGAAGGRFGAIDKFAVWLNSGREFGNYNATAARRKWILENLESLRGETLGCWCNFPREDCHGRIYIEKIT